MTDQGAKILMLGQDYDPEEGLRVTLLKGGYNVHTGRSEAEGMAELATWDPDVVLLDVSTPGLGGARFCKQVRANCEAHIIAFSADTDSAILIETLDAGADDFVWKPFSLAVVEARIRASLRRTSHGRDLTKPLPA